MIQCIISELLSEPQKDFRVQALNSLKDNVRTSDSTRRITYRSLNSDLSISPIYTSEAVSEFLRISFTRMRTSSHRLRIETGRWSRLARDLRLCPCGSDVQTEEHVFLSCPLTAIHRERQYPSTNELFKDNVNYAANLCYKIFNMFN